MIDPKTAAAGESDNIESLRGHGLEMVRYREARGRFTNLHQLDEASGLTGKTTGVDAHVGVQAG